jgi:hypothetical protein
MYYSKFEKFKLLFQIDLKKKYLLRIILLSEKVKIS